MKPEISETDLLSEKPGATIRQPIQMEEVKEISAFLWLRRWRRIRETTSLKQIAGRNPCDSPLATYIRLRPEYRTFITELFKLFRFASGRNAVQICEEVLKARGSSQ